MHSQLETLPKAPGIYLFYNDQQELIYVGKATTLRHRVRSYFQGGKKTSRPIEEMIHEVASLDVKETDSVLEAIILEAVYIKKYAPKYNVIGKDNKSWNYIVITKDVYPQVRTLRQHEFARLTETDKKKQYRAVFGPYPGLNTKATLSLLRKIFHFSSCSPDAKRPCLYYQIGQCTGVCTGEITPIDYRKQVITPLATFLRGGKKRLMSQWKKEMEQAAKAEQFERAAQLRDQLTSLTRIHDIALLNQSFIEDVFDTTDDSEIIRVEGYDISHFGGTGTVGSMVVFSHGEPDTAQYRTFTVKGVNGPDDVASLKEVLTRRLKRMVDGDRRFAERDPDLLLIDGGVGQLNQVVAVVDAFGLALPVVSIAKGKERKRNDFFFGPDTPQDIIHWVDRHKDILIRVRDEAHRFALKNQKKQRKIGKK